MQPDYIKTLYKRNKEEALFGRYVTSNDILPLLNALPNSFNLETIGKSVNGIPIHKVTIGSGKKRILMWSQMHGNESTTTKALFDLFNSFIGDEDVFKDILEVCTICIVPILNPDGAEAYTRINANKVDLNRDAQNLTQPESNVLRALFEEFKPHFCYNLHGQRTIFSAGNVNKSATVSFLAPAQDPDCTVTETRKVAMEVIAVMNKALQALIPNQVGVYDDAFNINCVGDTFQSANVPTILFEAGHFHNDYNREYTRELIYISYVTSLDYITSNEVNGGAFESYNNIPENEKLFFDIIIRNVSGYSDEMVDIAIQFKEILSNGKLDFKPIVEKIEKLEGFYGHKELDAKGGTVYDIDNLKLSIGNENVIVILNNEKIALKLK